MLTARRLLLLHESKKSVQIGFFLPNVATFVILSSITPERTQVLLDYKRSLHTDLQIRRIGASVFPMSLYFHSLVRIQS